jgi:hypothetical protein
MDEHSTDKESTESRTGERGQGNEKKRQREREREEEQRERGSPQKNRERARKHRGKNVHSIAHHTFIIVFAVSKESIGKTRKTETNTSFTSVRHCLQNQ